MVNVAPVSLTEATTLYFAQRRGLFPSDRPSGSSSKTAVTDGSATTHPEPHWRRHRESGSAPRPAQGHRASVLCLPPVNPLLRRLSYTSSKPVMKRHIPIFGLVVDFLVAIPLAPLGNPASCPDRVPQKHDFRPIPQKSSERVTTPGPVTPHRDSIPTRTRSQP